MIGPIILDNIKQGYIFPLESSNILEKIIKFDNTWDVYKVLKSAQLENIPNKISIKMQLCSNKNYKENYLPDDTPIKKYIPIFYYGCTLPLSFIKNNIYIRITFMEMLDPEYIPLLQLLQEKNNPPLSIYEELKKLLILLNTYGIIDIDIQQILINRHNNNIKIIDCDLSDIIKSMHDEVDDLFKNERSTDQSTITKLSELLTIFS
jgi:hypothetical protein